MQELDATFEQYLFNLIFYLLLSFSSWKLIYSKKVSYITWVLIIVFCVFSFFAGDWFNYKVSLPYITEDYKDPVYYYFAVLVGKEYLLYRLLIWGLATILFYYSTKRLKLSPNISAFVFIWLFLPTFCYARASLAMSSYFCGLSILSMKSYRSNRIISYIIGTFFIVSSFFFHRSFLPVIIATPIIYFKFNRKSILLLFMLLPLFFWALNSTLNVAMNESLLGGNEFDSFNSAASEYANQTRRQFNWKYMLVSNMKYIGLYIPFVYILWNTKLKKGKILLPPAIDNFFSVEIVIVVVATIFLYLSNIEGTSDVLFYRYLFMSGIPSVIILTYLIQSRIMKKNASLKIMFVVWLSTIGLIVGKLFALS